MKKIFMMLLAVLFTASLFAEKKSTGLTDSDVKNFIKNSTAISNEFDSAKININKKLSSKQKKAAEGILQKYGIEAPALEKYKMINSCIAVVTAEMQMKSQQETMSPEQKEIMEKSGADPLFLLKININSEDYEIVKANLSGVMDALSKFSEDAKTSAQ
ncbi:MAG: hypothetical protein IKX23_05610 [Treponema sp.]|nr:hypothetical protein [Treponema sp.]